MTERIIDFHTHPLYDFQFPEHGVRISPERFCADLAAQGVSRACGSVIYRDVVDRPLSAYEAMLPVLNDEALAFRDARPDFFVPGVHVHPAFARASCEELARCAARGVVLIGELVPYMMGYSRYACKGLLEILEYARELGMVVSMHPSAPEDMENLAAALPGLQMVFAHLSGYGGYEAHIGLMRRYENVCFDISAHGADRDGTLRDAINRVGRERVLFGTDYPGDGASGYIAAVRYERLTDGEREAVFYGNAARLLRL